MSSGTAVKRTTIGGQAVIEGIMMRGPHKICVSIRTPQGDIQNQMLDEKTGKRPLVLRLPIIRGVCGFVDSLRAGYKSISIAAEIASAGEEDEPKEKEKEEEKKNGLYNVIMSIAMVAGIVVALFLFLWVPARLFGAVNGWTGYSITGWKAVFEGVVKIIVFLAYITGITFMPDIKRMFMYHGAEHKTIFCYEAGDELTVENVRWRRRFHPRCGTSFLILMLLVSIVVDVIILAIFPALNANSLRMLWVAVKVILIPIVVGLGFELIRVCGRHDNIVTKIISAPGMWLQRITTKEPTDDMIEVAIAALKEVIPENAADDVW